MTDTLMEMCWGSDEDGHTPFYPVGECPAHVAVASKARHEREVEALGRVEMTRRQARAWADAQQAALEFREPVQHSLAEALLLPVAEHAYSIDEILPLGGNAIFAAEQKSGKTALTVQLARSYADSTEFLGRFQVHPEPDTTVVMMNFEMPQDLYIDWLRRGQIQNPNRVHLIQLRGNSLPFSSPIVQQKIVDWLVKAKCGMWIIDTAARAFIEGSIEKNDEAARFLSHVSDIKARAGVRDLIILTHVSHDSAKNGGRKALGAVAWSSWSDVNWNLSKDQEASADGRDASRKRFFQATGRDVDLPIGALDWDEDTMSNVYEGGTPDDVALSSVCDAVHSCIRDMPGISKAQVRDRVTASSKGVDEALMHLQAIGDITMEVGAKSRHSYTLTSALAKRGNQTEWPSEGPVE